LRLIASDGHPHRHTDCAPRQVILALERRPNDGVESFFALAEAAGFEVHVLLQVNRVVVVEMWWRSGGRGAVK
jgi:hypothetical protein